MLQLMAAQVSRLDNEWLSDGACANKHAPRSWKLAGKLIESNSIPQCSWFQLQVGLNLEKRA